MLDVTGDIHRTIAALEDARANTESPERAHTDLLVAQLYLEEAKAKLARVLGGRR